MQNCHFCNTNFVGIKVDSQGGWFCPSDCCGQYNGFNESGDYLMNHNEILNRQQNSNTFSPCIRRRVASLTKNMVNMPQKMAGKSGGNCTLLHDISSRVELCLTCQQNEYNKLQILNGYDPPPGTSYRTIEKFKRRLDKQYPLCNRCQRQNLTLKLPLINQKLS